MSESNNELFTFLESLRSAQENEKSPSRRSNRVNRGSSSQPSRSTDEDKDPFDAFLEDMQKSRSEDKSEDVREEVHKDESSEPTSVMDILLGRVAKMILERSEDSAHEEAEGVGEESADSQSFVVSQLLFDPQGVLHFVGDGDCECGCDCEYSDSSEYDEEIVDIFGEEFVANALEEFQAAADAGFIDGDKSAEYLFARLLDSTQTESAMSLARLAYTLGRVSALDAVQER